MKKIFVLTAILSLVLAACGDTGNSTGNEDGNNNWNNASITLTINNMSSYNLLNIEYSSVDFGTINSGKNIVKDVSAGTRYIFFILQIRGDDVRCRTTQALTCNEGNNEITFTNNTFITTAIDERTNTIKNIVDTLIAEKGLMIGDTGPGGGIIFYAQGGQYKECGGELGADEWVNAVNMAKNYRGGGFSDWQLPNRGDLDLIYQNLRRKNLGGFSQDGYWSSQEYDSYNAYIQNFSSSNINAWYIAEHRWLVGEVDYYRGILAFGEQDWVAKDESFRCRAVRSFSQ
jgi:hypothetical protein